MPVGGVDQVELLEQLSSPAAALRPAQVIQAPDELEVLAAGQLLLDRSRLAGQSDRAADRSRLAHHISSVHQRAALVRQQQRRQDAHRGGLARAVRAKDAENRSAWHDQVDPAQRVHVAERLRQSLDQNPWP
jgi:hypothetical protein